MLVNASLVAGLSAATLTLSDRDSAWSQGIAAWTGSTASGLWGAIGGTPPEAFSGAISPLVPVAFWLVDLFAPWRDGPWALLLLPLCAALLLLGSLLPDADSKSSLLGRFLPSGWAGPHRGATHTDWASVALLLPGLLVSWLSPLLWLWLGYALHLSVDGLSAAGRARFWPLGKWRTITYDDGSDCVVVDGRRRGLYRSGALSETLVLLVLCGAGISLLAAAVLA